jgi:cation transport ATPase
MQQQQLEPPPHLLDTDVDSNTDSTDTDTMIVHLQVTGMMCQRNCGTTVANALLSIPGVVSAEAVHAESRARAVVDRNIIMNMNTTITEELIDVVECVGFDCSLIEDIDVYFDQLLLEKQQQQQEDHLEHQRQQSLLQPHNRNDTSSDRIHASNQNQLSNKIKF